MVRLNFRTNCGTHFIVHIPRQSNTIARYISSAVLLRQRAKTRRIVCSREVPGEVAVGGRGEKYTAHGRTSIVVVRLSDVSNGRTLKFQLRR